MSFVPMNIYTFHRAITNPGAVTLLQLAASSTKPLVILSAVISASGLTSVTTIRARLVRKTAAATVTAAVTTQNTGDFSKEGANWLAPSVQLGTALSGYTATAEGTDGEWWPLQYQPASGALYLPIPEPRIVVPSSGILGLKAMDAPPAGTYDCAITFGEIG